ncbi:MAG: sensor histidine kinase [Actinomycetota bacterium]|nr:sensor histidine kinase [Actinomycetota bacterium]
MDRLRLYSWTVVSFTVALFLWLTYQGGESPSLGAYVFWISLLLAVELLPVSLAFGTEVTMGFPVYLAVALLFPPWVAMLIAGVSAFDMREVRREIPLHQALFNRAQLMLAVAAASAVFSWYGRDNLFDDFSALGAVVVVLGALADVLTNLSLVAFSVYFDDRIPLRQAFRGLLPDPVGGFVISYILLTGLGTATAAVYETDFGKWAVAAFMIPLIFARLSILGARAQQELAERVRKQQQALLAATEKVFEERENERKRIAEDIHDTSLQMLAAASYGCGNAREFLEAGHNDQAVNALSGAREALEDAIRQLRGSLVDLRKSSVEHGGLVETIRKFADQVSTVWGAEVRIEGNIENEPPIPVALAAVQILQEGLVNALKHGGTGGVVIRIEDLDGMVHLAVEDDGPGFDPQAEVGADHVGMRLMKERAARVGGRIEIDSTPGRGTRLEAILPGGVTQ